MAQFLDRMSRSARFVFIAICVTVGAALLVVIASIFFDGQVKSVLQNIAGLATALAVGLGLLFAFVGESRR